MRALKMSCFALLTDDEGLPQNLCDQWTDLVAAPFNQNDIEEALVEIIFLFAA
jgi:hypothetical protein